MARESAAGAARRLLGGVGVDGGGRPPEPPEPGRPPGTVWVTNQTLNTVAAYEARTGELLRTVNVGARPIGVVAPPGSRRASRRSAAT